ncbi:MAG: MATE family efflux transporter [bacterium]|nr:MATE family efflux transporter [bacterium]
MIKRIRHIFALALPIIGGMASQTVMNIADTVLVGRLPDASTALSAVGYGGFAAWAVAAFLVGIGSAVQTVAARRMGESRERASGHALTMGLWLAIIVGVPMSCLGVIGAGAVFPWFIDDAAVVAAGAPYLGIRCGAWFLIMANFSFRGFFNGVGRPRVYFSVVWLVQLLNIVFSYLLIYGFAARVAGVELFAIPALGVSGAGLGTVMATLCGTFMYGVIGRYYQRSHGAFFLPAAASQRRELLATLVRLAVPAGLTGLISSVGFLIFLIIAGDGGPKVVAATTLLVNLASACFLPAIGFGLAAATLVSNSLGAREPDEAFRWGLMTTGLAALILGCVGLIFILFPEDVLSAFTHDQTIIQLALPIMIILGAGQAMDSAGNAISHALIGAGAVRAVLLMNLIGMWLVFLPGAYVWGVLYDGGMIGLWIPLFVFRLGLALVAGIIFVRRRWIHIKV